MAKHFQIRFTSVELQNQTIHANLGAERYRTFGQREIVMNSNSSADKIVSLN